MSDAVNGRSGGVSNSGTINISEGSVIGGDMTVHTTTSWSSTQITQIWQPVAEAIKAAPVEEQSEANRKFDDLKKEVAKADNANDSTVARLIKGLVNLAPSAVSAVVGAFATPLLSSVSGPVTKFILQEIGGT